MPSNKKLKAPLLKRFPDRFHRNELTTFVTKKLEGEIVLYNFDPFELLAQHRTTLMEFVR
jgi:hypothetical protein